MSQNLKCLGSILLELFKKRGGGANCLSPSQNQVINRNKVFLKIKIKSIIDRIKIYEKIKIKFIYNKTKAVYYKIKI